MNLTLSTDAPGIKWTPREMTSLYRTTMYYFSAAAKSVYCRPYAYGAPNSHLVLCDTQHLGVFHMLCADTIAMGRVLDVW